MIECCNISITHEYEEGRRSSHLKLEPFSNLKRLAFNNRLRIKNERAGVLCFCEEDRQLLLENEYLCFWMIYLNTDFIQYSDYEKDMMFNRPKFQWIETREGTTENSYQLIAEPLTDETKGNLIHPDEKIPPHAIGLIAIPTELLTERTSFQIQFTTKATYWQYRIQSDLKPQDWSFSIEDKKIEWEFERNEELGEIRFTSKAILPYFKKANDRLLLKWKPTNDPFNFQTYQKVLPFPNFRYQETINQEEISPVYIKI